MRFFPFLRPLSFRFFSTSYNTRRILDTAELIQVLPFSYGVNRIKPNLLNTVKVFYRVPQNHDGKVVTQSDGWIQVVLPFASDPLFYSTYQLFTSERIRAGKLLEDLDALAGDVAVRHYKSLPENKHANMHVVTAAVDRVKFVKKLSTANDLLLEAFVSWVGSSSCEVTIKLFIQPPPGSSSCESEHLGSAYFIMVCKSLEQKKIVFPPLALESELEKADYVLAEERKKLRQLRNSKDLSLAPPTAEESEYLHNVFLNAKKLLSENALGFNTRENVEDLNSDYRFIYRTNYASSLIMHAQNRNTAGKIFGGHLMSVATELSWINAYMLSGSFPRLVEIDDITFIRPVEIGSIVKFRSLCAFTDPKKRRVVVAIAIEHHDPITHNRDTTNTFFFTYECPPVEIDGKIKPVPLVVPYSYEESMLFLHAKRVYELQDDK